MTELDVKYKLGLALSGGGARGFGHAGAIKAIEDAGYKPDLISGTSAGAIVAVFYADGYTPEEITEMFVGRSFREFAEIQVPAVSIFGMDGFARLIRKNLRKTHFEDLDIPVRIVATDLDNGQMKIFDKGPILKALMASCSIPILFKPIVINGIHYVDGGIFKNFPVSIIRRDCEKLIGVNVSPMVSRQYTQTLLHIAERAYHYMSRTNTFLDRNQCDILIEIEDLIEYRTFDLKNALNIFEIGYKHGKTALDENK